MTYEDAIKFFEEIITGATKDMISQYGIDACNMAIDALRNQQKIKEVYNECATDIKMLSTSLRTELIILRLIKSIFDIQASDNHIKAVAQIKNIEDGNYHG